MDWEKVLSKKRLGTSDVLPERPGRSEFESDIDRIIFSGAFRRLGRKTQVHPLAANDHIHSRLTHSLEVSRVGHALGKELGQRLRADDSLKPMLPKAYQPDDLGAVVEAACLAHDLGNPPFGHAGEDAVIHWFDQNSDSVPENLGDDFKFDLRSLEGNAQGFRIITQLENHIFSGGLRLTYATLAAFQKYPWSSRAKQKKFGAYISEEKILDEIFRELGIPRRPDGRWSRHPLAYLVEAADDICYGVIDMEDAVELGILAFDEAARVLLDVLDEAEREKVRSAFLPKGHRVNFARMRGRVFDKAIGGAIEAYVKNYGSIMNGDCNSELFKLLAEEDPRRKLIENAKKLGREHIYNDTKKVEIEIGCYSTFDVLLAEFCEAALNQAEVLQDGSGERKLHWRADRILRLLGDHAPSKQNAPPQGWSAYQCLRRVIDFITGMTDNYAVYIARQLQGAAFSGGQRP